MRPRNGYLEIVTCTLTWGTIGSIVKHVGVASPAIVFFRLLFGLLVVLVWLAARGSLRALRPGARFKLLVASGITLAVHWAMLFEAFKRLDVATTILIVFLGPILMAVAAPAVLHERLQPRALGALALAFGGIALIAVPEIGRIDPLGLVFVLAGAVLFAVLVLMGKLIAPHYDPGAVVAWQSGVAAIVVSPGLARVSSHGLVRALPLLALLGIVHTGLTGILFFRAVRALKAQTLGVLFYLEPASAVLYAWWLLHEQPTAFTLAGGALIVAAGLGIILMDRVAVAPAALPEPIPGKATG